MSNAELIEQADDLRGDESEVFYMMHKLKDALEVAEQNLAAAQAVIAEAKAIAHGPFGPWDDDLCDYGALSRILSQSPADALQAHDREVAAKTLTDLLTPESLEAARLQVEDTLIEWRDLRLSVLRNNGLVVAEKDGTRSDIIRMGFEGAFALVIRARAAALGVPEEAELR